MNIGCESTIIFFIQTKKMQKKIKVQGFGIKVQSSRLRRGKQRLTQRLLSGL
jgi:hypothetical protein